MRWLRVAAVVGVILCGAGCARAIDGIAVAPDTNPTETVLLTGDGFGVQLGQPTARVALEMFMEPQCSLCARLEMFQGGEIADYIDSGDLVVTYRLVTSSTTGPTGYSHRVSNALFVAADAGLAAVEVQRFVQQLYWDADPSGTTSTSPPSPPGRGCPSRHRPHRRRRPAVDTVAMDNANRKRLNDRLCQLVATPTVYDLNTTRSSTPPSNDWLKRLVGHR